MSLPSGPEACLQPGLELDKRQHAPSTRCTAWCHLSSCAVGAHLAARCRGCGRAGMLGTWPRGIWDGNSTTNRARGNQGRGCITHHVCCFGCRPTSWNVTNCQPFNRTLALGCLALWPQTSCLCYSTLQRAFVGDADCCFCRQLSTAVPQRTKKVLVPCACLCTAVPPGWAVTAATTGSLLARIQGHCFMACAHTHRSVNCPHVPNCCGPSWADIAAVLSST